MLLHDHVVPALPERQALPVVTFMQDDVPSNILRDVKTFLLESFTVDQVISRYCKIQWPLRLSDLNPAVFWLWEVWS